ncbi:sodium-dependent proline transporter [Crotalus adamanteus]|uniref:Sodium-dependent proline transporter n=1 Tax=Crotalus adamanteus TaxID=8729 RepID=A0AAW1BW95_CROAD
MELSLGQFSSLGPLAVWKISPLFKGIGMATILIVSLVAIYYNMIIAYVLFYLFASLTNNLPWQYCGNWWNTDLCLDHHVMHTGNSAVPFNTSNTVSPSEEYWKIMDGTSGDRKDNYGYTAKIREGKGREGEGRRGEERGEGRRGEGRGEERRGGGERRGRGGEGRRGEERKG